MLQIPRLHNAGADHVCDGRAGRWSECARRSAVYQEVQTAVPLLGHEATRVILEAVSLVGVNKKNVFPKKIL